MILFLIIQLGRIHFRDASTQAGNNVFILGFDYCNYRRIKI